MISPETISEMTDDDDIGNPETLAHEKDELPSPENLLETCLQRTREAKNGYDKVEDPDTVAIAMLGDLQERSQPLASSSIDQLGDSPGNVFRLQALAYP